MNRLIMGLICDGIGRGVHSSFSCGHRTWSTFLRSDQARTFGTLTHRGVSYHSLSLVVLLVFIWHDVVIYKILHIRRRLEKLCLVEGLLVGNVSMRLVDLA